MCINIKVNYSEKRQSQFNLYRCNYPYGICFKCRSDNGLKYQRS